MIKIKIEAQSGADLRAQLIALLGGLDGQTLTITGDALLPSVSRAANQEAPVPTMEIVKPEEKTAKKLTKKEQAALDAEEAAKNAEATSQEAGTDDTPSDTATTLAQDNAEQNGEEKITLDILRDMVLRLSRNGLKEETKKIIGTFKVERITEMSEDQYPAFFAAIKPNYDKLTDEQV